MCVSPIHIRPKVPKVGIPAEYHFDSPYRPMYARQVNLRKIIEVPCGKCAECLHKRQNSMAFRLYKQMEKHRYAYHFTLTYRPEKLPFAITYRTINKFEYCDPDTGEVLPPASVVIDSASSLCEDGELLQRARLAYQLAHVGKAPVYLFNDWIELDDVYCERMLTPSLDRSDVRSWIKVARIYLKRRNIDSPLIYSFCGEYGPKTNRPHFHCVIMSDSDLRASGALSLLKNLWKTRFGNVEVRVVPVLNEDGTSARQIVSRYVSKYVSKGRYENPACLAGYCEKGRICQSLEDFKFYDSLRSYHLAFDLYGPYDPNTMEYYSPIQSYGHTFYKAGTSKRFTQDQIIVLLDEIIKRSYVSFGESKDHKKKYRIKMPRLWFDKLFKFTKVYENGTKKVKRTRLSYLVASRVQFLQESRENERFNRLVEKEGVELACKIYNSSRESNLRIRKEMREKAYEKFLQSSNF